MTKYTLYAQNGRFLRSGKHYLHIGDWLEFSPDRVILEHGMLTDGELRQLRSQSLVNVYQHGNLHTVSITVPYDGKYFSRQTDQSKLMQYIGCLKRVNLCYYVGEVNVK